MYLKSIEMTGFKSFADRTRFQFEPGLTAVVGPNGCGKSNVVDAVRWVLGEQSAKAIRGSSMADCIFAGTDQRKALGLAEVSLTLGDCESLGLEYNEITVSRRVFRSGEGQYLINKTPCRLKDIQRLFMDTGIGTNAYMLMEQGKIDRLINAKPEERRVVIDEASGITKYKADKKEATRKLEQTEANLLRLDDILREVKRQIGSLQRQAGKARRYQAHRERLKALDLYAARLGLRDLDQARERLERRRISAHEQEEAARQAIREATAAVEALRHEVAETEHAIEQAMEQHLERQGRVAELRRQAEWSREALRDLHGQAERGARDAEEADAERSRDEARRQDLEARLAEFEAHEGEARTRAEALQQALADREGALRDQQRALQAARNRQMEADRLLARLNNQIMQIQAQRMQDQVRHDRLLTEQTEHQQALVQARRREEEAAARETEVNQALTARTQEIEALQEEAGSAEQDTGSLQAELQALASRRAGLLTEIGLIDRWDEERGGYGRGAKALMDRPAAFGLSEPEFLGPLVSRVRARPGYEAAFQAVLRTWQDLLVVDSADALARAGQALAEASAGAARLAAAGVAPEAALPPVPGTERLIDHLELPEGWAGLVARLVGPVVVGGAETLAGLPEDRVLVTRDGVVHRPRWMLEIHAPDGSLETDPLARRQRRDALQKERAALEAEQARIEARVEARQSDRAALRERIRATQDALAQLRMEAGEVAGELRGIRQQVAQSENRLGVIASELGQAAARSGQGEERHTQVQSEIESAKEDLAGILEAIRTGTQAVEDLEARRAEAQNQVMDARMALSEATQQTRMARAEIQHLQARIQAAARRREERIGLVHESEQRIREAEAAIARAEADLPGAEAAGAETQDRLAEVRTARQHQQARLQQGEQDLETRRGGLEQIQETRNQLDIELAETRMRRANLLERVMEDHRVPEEDVLGAASPAAEGEPPPPRDAVEAEAAELRARIEAMGPVNLVAIDEYQELEERHAFLTQQQEDLTTARTQLLDLIRQINRTSRELFLATFEQVNERFKELFRTLFHGGEAQLVLVDEEDALESGIEIIAKPPGKKLESISLLSGGERTMTAVALLFALYMVKPSPFCLLDELDAALDDSNIGRFVDMLKGFLKTTQFVVVTHNRQTIAAADLLYGVTMEERGVSKLVSMKFGEQENDTRLDAPGGPRRQPAPA